LRIACSLSRVGRDLDPEKSKDGSAKEKDKSTREVFKEEVLGRSAISLGKVRIIETSERIRRLSAIFVTIGITPIIRNEGREATALSNVKARLNA
jgi:hypothetical protein